MKTEIAKLTLRQSRYTKPEFPPAPTSSANTAPTTTANRPPVIPLYDHAGEEIHKLHEEVTRLQLVVAYYRERARKPIRETDNTTHFRNAVCGHTPTLAPSVPRHKAVARWAGQFAAIRQVQLQAKPMF